MDDDWGESSVDGRRPKMKMNGSQEPSQGEKKESCTEDPPGEDERWREEHSSNIIFNSTRSGSGVEETIVL